MNRRDFLAELEARYRYARLPALTLLLFPLICICEYYTWYYEETNRLYYHTPMHHSY